MVLYHNSNELLAKLTPKLGHSRHDGEDPRAVGKPVVWFSNKPQVDKPPMKYRYEVDIPEDDSDLLLDEPFAKLQVNFSKMFKVNNDWRWYFCFHEVDVNATYEWDPNKSDYVKI